MKEDITKKLLKKSLVKTSDNFTDKLITSIQAEEIKHSFSMPLKEILLVLAIITLLISAITFKLLNTINVFSELSFPRLPVFIITIIILLSSINYILRLNETVSLINNVK